MVDGCLIRLFESTAEEFSTNGFGSLMDATSCQVYEERNGQFELTMKYPVTGKHFSELTMRRILVAKSNPYSTPQAFRIYDISKPINGIITVSAQHISYDLSGKPVSPFSASSAMSAMVAIKDHSVEKHPFTFSTDKDTVAEMSIVVPYSSRAVLGGIRGSILDTYGGEYEFNNFQVTLHNNRGANRGVSIRYGKNLTDLEQEENCSNVYTGVYPYWYSEEDGLVQLSGADKIVRAEGTYNFSRIYVLDLSDKWQEPPTDEQLRSQAESYIKTNDIGVPKVSLKVSFVPLSQTEEYKDYSLLETVHLCDTVNVEFPLMNVSANAKCISTTYNVLTDKYDEIGLGEAKSNLASTIADQGSYTQQAVDSQKTFFERAIEHATKLITGGLGGYVILHSSTGGKTPDELLVLDAESGGDYRQAKNIWRFNVGGLGHSSKGYNGPFDDAAITMDGHINAKYIAARTFDAGIIEVGVMQSRPDENGIRAFIFDFDAGTAEINATKFSLLGKSINDISSSEAEKSINNFKTSVLDPVLDDLKDSSVDSYFGSVIPTINNYPANTWIENEKAENHLNDTYTIVDNKELNGKSYRFTKDSRGVYSWTEITDQATLNALALASKAQDTADGKRTSFVGNETPTPPYDEGDVWYRENQPTLVCIQSRGENENYSPDDWKKYDYYIDAVAAKNAIDEYKKEVLDPVFDQVQRQLDQKIDSYFGSVIPTINNYPANTWGDDPDDPNNKANHVNDTYTIVNSSDASLNGKSYRYVVSPVSFSGGTEYIWEEIVDPGVLNALQQASLAKDTADGKRRTFIGNYIPTPPRPYDRGDVWYRENQSTLVCITSRAANETGSSSDWVKYDYYIDKATANSEALSVWTNSITKGSVFDKLFKKSNGTYAQGIQMVGEEVYMNATYINSGEMSASRILGGTLILGGPNQGLLVLRDVNGNDICGMSGSQGFHVSDMACLMVQINPYNPPASYPPTPVGGVGSGPCAFQFYADGTYGNRIDTLMNFQVAGNFSVNGSKSRIVSTKNYNDRLEYCYEMARPMFGDIGSAVLDDSGKCYISINDIFSETISSRMEYYVFLQKEGPGDLWVSRKDTSYFVVEGTPNLRFSWELKAIQKDYEYSHLDREDAQRVYEFYQFIDYEALYQEEVEILIKERESI